MGSAAILYVQLIKTKHVSASMLLLCGLFYVLFLLAVFNGIITG
ncbi:MAG: hypothetical protein NTV45_01545 [Firmicutes bacterium]|nr:hypothetical protein [Bacillota bacterium]